MARVFSARNDVDREIATSVLQGAQYYTVAYSPSDGSDTPGQYRSVRIALGRKGLTATTRDGYFVHDALPTPSDTSPVEAQKEFRDEVNDVATAALSKMAYNGLSVRAGRFSAGRFSIAIEDRSLTWKPGTEDGSSESEVSVAAVCFSSQGKVLSHISLKQRFHRQASSGSIHSTEIFNLPVDAPEGTVRIRFVLRDASSGHLGTAEVPLP